MRLQTNSSACETHAVDFMIDMRVLGQQQTPSLCLLLHRSQLLNWKLCWNEKSHCLPGSTTPWQLHRLLREHSWKRRISIRKRKGRSQMILDPQSKWEILCTCTVTQHENKALGWTLNRWQCSSGGSCARYPCWWKHRRTLTSAAGPVSPPSQGNKREEKQCAVHQCQDSPGHADYSKIVMHSENALSGHWSAPTATWWPRQGQQVLVMSVSWWCNPQASRRNCSSHTELYQSVKKASPGGNTVLSDLIF